MSTPAPRPAPSRKRAAQPGPGPDKRRAVNAAPLLTPPEVVPPAPHLFALCLLQLQHLQLLMTILARDAPQQLQAAVQALGGMLFQDRTEGLPHPAGPLERRESALAAMKARAVEREATVTQLGPKDMKELSDETKYTTANLYRLRSNRNKPKLKRGRKRKQDPRNLAAKIKAKMETNKALSEYSIAELARFAGMKYKAYHRYHALIKHEFELMELDGKNYWSDDEDALHLQRQLINLASTSLYIQMYSFTLMQLADDIIAAFQRGVDVRVFGDYRNLLSQHGHPVYLKLLDAGVPVYTLTTSETQHAKVVVVDGSLVQSGSGNWSKNALGHSDANGDHHRGRSREYNTIRYSPAEADKLNAKAISACERHLVDPEPMKPAVCCS